MIKKIWKSMAIASMALLLASNAQAAINWKIAHNKAENTPVGIAAQKYADKVREVTNGEVNITVYPNAQLGDWSIICERVSMGVIEMGFVPQNSQSDKRVSIYYFPGLFTDLDHMKRNMTNNAEFRQELDKLLEKQNMKTLAQWPAFFGGASFKIKPKNWENIEAPKGLKVRTAKDPTLLAIADLMGFLPTPMPSTESYTALQTGVIDGVFGPGAEGHYNWFRDVIKYYAPIQDHMEIFSLVVNDQAWAQLDENLQAKLTQVAMKMEEERYATFYADEDSWLKKIEDAGIEILPFSEKDVQKLAALAREKTWPDLAKKIDPEYINFILGTLKP